MQKKNYERHNSHSLNVMCFFKNVNKNRLKQDQLKILQIHVLSMGRFTMI